MNLTGLLCHQSKSFSCFVGMYKNVTIETDPKIHYKFEYSQ